MATEADILDVYAKIGESLKKRFMKAPNILKADGEYRELYARAQKDGCRYYSAFVLQAIARCELALGSGFGEAAANAEAGHMLLTMDLEEHSIGYEGYDDAMTDATRLFHSAIASYIASKKFALAASLYLEVGRAHSALKSPRKALLCVTSAIGCWQKTVVAFGALSWSLLAAMEGQVLLLVEIQEFELAMETLEAISEMCSAARRAGNIEILDRCDAALASALIWQALIAVRLSDNAALLAVCETLLILTDSSALDPALPDLLESLGDAKRRGDAEHLRVLKAELRSRCRGPQVALLESVDSSIVPSGLGNAMLVDLADE